MAQPIPSLSYRVLRPVAAAVPLTLVLTLGCSQGSPNDETETDSFISHVPGSSRTEGSVDAAGTGGSSAGDGDGAEADDDSADRAIAEADIIQVDGDRLYALSQFSGLSVVNIADPTNLRLARQLPILR